MKRLITFLLTILLVTSSLLQAYDVQERLQLGIKNQNVQEVKKALNDGAQVDREVLRLALSHVERSGKQSIYSSVIGGLMTALGGVGAYFSFEKAYSHYNSFKNNFNWLWEVANRKSRTDSKVGTDLKEVEIDNIKLSQNEKGNAPIAGRYYDRQCKDDEKLLAKDREKRFVMNELKKKHNFEFSKDKVTAQHVVNAIKTFGDSKDVTKPNAALLYDSTFKKNILLGTGATLAAGIGLVAYNKAKYQYQKSLTIAWMVLSQPGVKVDDSVLKRYEDVLTRVYNA